MFNFGFHEQWWATSLTTAGLNWRIWKFPNDDNTDLFDDQWHSKSNWMRAQWHVVWFPSNCSVIAGYDYVCAIERLCAPVCDVNILRCDHWQKMVNENKTSNWKCPFQIWHGIFRFVFEFAECTLPAWVLPAAEIPILRWICYWDMDICWQLITGVISMDGARYIWHALVAFV